MVSNQHVLPEVAVALILQQRYEATLRNLHHGDDWDKMCQTTPAVVNGIYFDHPTVCQDRVCVSDLLVYDITSQTDYRTEGLAYGTFHKHASSDDLVPLSCN